MQTRKRCRVLVTGAGSGVGQGIVKALRIAELPVTVVCADIAPMNAALYRADEALLIPRVESPGALEVMIDLIQKNHIQVVMVGSEFDLAFFAQHQGTILEKSGARVIAAPPETVAIANDKWLTSEFLRTSSLPYAQSCIPDNQEEAVSVAADWGFPLVVKTRCGTSSRHVHIVWSPVELLEVWPNTPSPMLQRLVDMPTSELNNEYTCSVFKTELGTILGPFHARRTLRGGTSWHVEVDRFPALDTLLLDIGRALPFSGSLNVQLIIGASGPVPFELNARFSGTTAVRAHFGFNEPAMALRSFHYGEEPEPPVIRRGVAMRYHEEVFIDDIAVADIKPNVSKGYVRPWF